MGKDIWDDGYSYLEDKDAQYYDEYIERLDREEKEHNDWLRIRYAEPGDTDYDEFESLMSVEEYIEEHRDELTYDDICELKEQYMIFDDDFSFLGASGHKSTCAQTTQNKPPEPSPQTNSSANTKTVVNLRFIIFCFILAIVVIGSTVDIMTMVLVVFIIVSMGFIIWLFKSVLKS